MATKIASDMEGGRDIVDRIYEAAFMPQLWQETLGCIATASGSASGSLLIFSEPNLPPSYRTTELTAAALANFVSSDAWRNSRRATALFDQRSAENYGLRFNYVADHIDTADDAVDQALASLGLDAQIATMIRLPTREIVSFTFERLRGHGRHDPHQIHRLDEAWPHMARAAMIGARLRLEQAQATASALQAIGLPAAVLSHSGRVLAANDLLASMPSVFIPTAREGLAIAEPIANDLLRRCVEAVNQSGGSPAYSIPVKAAEDRPPIVLHILPISRSAQDIFSGADVLVAATAMEPQGGTPAPSILSGLFDLTAAEARLAAALARGDSLKQYAAGSGITFATARKYLDRIYSKTGTHRQNELVALLKGAQPLQPAPYAT